MRADVVINVSAVSMLGVVADLLTDVEVISVVFAVINLEFCFKVVYIVEELIVASAGAMTGGGVGADARVDSKLVKAMMTAPEYASPAPLEDMFPPC